MASASYGYIGRRRCRYSNTLTSALVHPDDKARFWSEWVLALQGHREYNAHYRALIDGQERWFSVRACAALRHFALSALVPLTPCPCSPVHNIAASRVGS